MTGTRPTNLRPASDSGPSIKSAKSFKWAAAGSIAGALGIASCCLLPVVLLSLGLGGAWVGSLAALTPFKPLFMLVTAALLAYGHYLAYFAPKKACVEVDNCRTSRTTRWIKLVLWSATILALAGWGIDYVEPYLVG